MALRIKLLVTKHIFTIIEIFSTTQTPRTNTYISLHSNHFF